MSSGVHNARVMPCVFLTDFDTLNLLVRHIFSVSTELYLASEQMIKEELSKIKVITDFVGRTLACAFNKGEDIYIAILLRVDMQDGNPWHETYFHCLTSPNKSFYGMALYWYLNSQYYIDCADLQRYNNLFEGQMNF